MNEIAMLVTSSKRDSIELDLSGLDFSYPNSPPLFFDFSFQLHRGEVASVVGMSGSGKSSLLKLLAGLLPWERGEITYRKKPLEGAHQKLIPGHDEICLVSQEFDLQPYQTTLENVQRHIKGDPNKEKKALRWLQRLGMKPFYNTKVENLSGGQKQRVAIAQALVAKPQLLLFDEPFSHLDPLHKNELSGWLYKALKEVGKSAVFTFHDPRDAFRVSDVIWVMDKGKWVQKGTPEFLYDNPKNSLVAKLLGEVNFVTPEDLVSMGVKPSGKSYRGKFLVRPEDSRWETMRPHTQVIERVFQGDHWMILATTPSGHKVFYRLSRIQ